MALGSDVGCPMGVQMTWAVKLTVPWASGWLWAVKLTVPKWTLDKWTTRQMDYDQLDQVRQMDHIGLLDVLHELQH